MTDESEGGNKVPASWKLLNWTIGPALIFFSAYFLVQEVRQLRIEGKGNMKNGIKEYLSSGWNYLDIIPPILIILVVLTDLIFAPKKIEGAAAKVRFSMQAIASFGMWLKIFYFLRIFRKTGFFVNMFREIIKASFTFFQLYLLILFAFASSFYIMSPPVLENTWRSAFFYAYLLGLGEFGDMEWETFYAPRMF